MANSTKPKMNKVRLLVCAAIASLIMLIMLYLYCTQVQDVISELDAASKSMDNIIWVVRNVANLLPLVAVSLFQLAVYSTDGDHRGLYHREQRIECIVAMLFTFLVMLPYVCIKSRTGEAADEAASAEDLFEQTYMWFATQLIPFIILIMYHGVRYKAEQQTPVPTAGLGVKEKESEAKA